MMSASVDPRNTARRRRRAALGSALFALVPAAVAGLGPWLATGYQLESPLPIWGWPLRALGATIVLAALPVLIAAFGRFAGEGLGTPAPAAPTARLVLGGGYRYVRNPMYVAVGAAIVGQALLLGQLTLLLYAAAYFAAVASFVALYEEPTLRRRYGQRYDEYRAAVPAWLPRRTPWSPR